MSKSMLAGLLLCLSIIVSGFLTSCGNSNARESGQIYTASQIDLQADIGRSFSAARLDDAIWTLCARDGGYNIVSVDRGGKIAIGDNSYVISLDDVDNISGFTVKSNGVITLVRETEGILEVYQLLENGTVSSDVRLDADLSGAAQSMEYISAATDSAGNIYIAWSAGFGTNGITSLSEEGTVLFTLSCSDQIYGMAMLDENTPVALLSGSTLRTIDAAAMEWGESIDVDGSYSKIYSGENGIVYLDDNKYLSEYDFKSNALTRLFGWAAVGVSTPIWAVSAGDGAFVAYNTEGFFRIQPETDGELPDTREVITLATANAALITTEIAEFNQSNGEYRIEVTEYSEGDVERLLTEISSGDIPDIIFYDTDVFFTRALSSQTLGARGFLADIYDYIDGDEELDRFSFQSNILAAAAQGDSLFELPYAFWVDVVAGDASILGSGKGWTCDDMLETLESLSFDGYLLGPNLSRDFVLYFMLSFNADEYIDWSEGTCSFDSPDFQKLLEIVKAYAPAANEESTESDVDLISQGRQLLVTQTMGTTNYMQIFDFFFNDTVLIGFPASSGNGNAISYDGSFAISANTEHGDAVWLFIRQFYTLDYYLQNKEVFVFPINAEALELKYEYIEEEFSISVGDGGEQGDYTITVSEPTEEDIRRTRELIESLDRVSRPDISIYEIVAEEAQAYFEDSKTVEDATAIIQNRVQTYVSEQMN